MKLILPLLLLFLKSPICGQVWATPGSEWHFEHWASFKGPGYLRMTVEATVTINAKQCEQLKIEEYTTTANSTHYLFTHIFNNVVYNVTNFVTDTLFNFNAVPGDKWRMTPTTYPQCNAGRVIVQDTGRRLIQGQTLKWLKVNYLSNTKNFTDTVYERFGALTCYPYNSFNTCPSGTDGNFGGALKCFSDYQLSNFVTDTSKTCRYLNLVSIAQTSVDAPGTELFPNPTDNEFEIRVTGSTPISEIIVTDIFGKSNRISIPGDRARVNVSQYPCGVYTLRIKYLSEHIITRRLIISR